MLWNNVSKLLFYAMEKSRKKINFEATDIENI
jgi:hypothetical protein